MTQPEALRLADLIRSRHGNDINDEAAAELRRQHGEIKSMQAERLRSERRLSAVEAQRDALLRVLKDCEIALRTVAKSDDEFVMARHQVREVRAVIKAVEEGK